MVKSKVIAGAILGLCLAAGASRADSVLWVTDARGEIGRVDVGTGAVTLVGNAGVVLTDIAFDPAGNLYGISFTDLYSVSTTTGLATDLGTITNGAGVGFNALVFGADGTLYAAGIASKSLFSINTSTAAATNLGDVGAFSGGDLAFAGGNLYLSSSSNHLIRISNPSGPASGIDVGPINFASVFGLASPDNAILYGVAGTQIITVNPATGAGALVTDFGGQGLGQAFGESFVSESAVVPEPSSLALSGIACLTALGYTWRRRAQEERA